MHRRRRRSFSNARLDYRVREEVGKRIARAEKKILIFSYSPLFLILSKYNIQSGHISFVSHSLALIFKHRRRRPSNLMSFSLSLFFLSCSLGRHRVIWGSYTIIVHVVDAATNTQQTTSYIFLYIIIHACIYIILAFRFSHRFKSSIYIYIYVYNLDLCCFVVVVFFCL